jgi:O-acetylserine/cysteine efflux transporter
MTRRPIAIAPMEIAPTEIAPIATAPAASAHRLSAEPPLDCPGAFEPLKLMAWMSLFTVPQVLVVSAALEHGQLASLTSATPLAWIAFAYTVLFGAIAGFGLWFWLIAECSIARVAPFALLQAVFAIAAGVLFLHEPLTISLIAGAAICIAGVAISQSRPSRRQGALAACASVGSQGA